MSCIVFDLDETIGFFPQVGIVWDVINNYNKGKLHETDFFSLMDLFPNVLRPGILKTLDYINKKKGSDVSKIVLYTNNMGHPSWARMIIGYIHYKLGKQVFDVIIPGHVGMKFGELSCRTSPLKTYDDLVRCANISRDTPVCFVDDQPHAKMTDNPMVTSVFVNAYNHFYTTSAIIKNLGRYTYYKSVYEKSIREGLEDYLLDYNSKPRENTNIMGEIESFLKEHPVKKTKELAFKLTPKKRRSAMNKKTVRRVKTKKPTRKSDKNSDKKPGKRSIKKSKKKSQ
jgi:hypothetical protein